MQIEKLLSDVNVIKQNWPGINCTALEDIDGAPGWVKVRADNEPTSADACYYWHIPSGQVSWESPACRDDPQQSSMDTILSIARQIEARLHEAALADAQEVPCTTRAAGGAAAILRLVELLAQEQQQSRLEENNMLSDRVWKAVQFSISSVLSEIENGVDVLPEDKPPRINTREPYPSIHPLLPNPPQLNAGTGSPETLNLQPQVPGPVPPLSESDMEIEESDTARAPSLTHTIDIPYYESAQHTITGQEYQNGNVIASDPLHVLSAGPQPPLPTEEPTQAMGRHQLSDGFRKQGDASHEGTLKRKERSAATTGSGTIQMPRLAGRTAKGAKSLIDRWHAAKKELEEEGEEEPRYEESTDGEAIAAAVQRQRAKEAEEWRLQHLRGGAVGSSANFAPVVGDWRERVRAAKASQSHGQ